MTANIPVNVKAIINDLPKIKQQTAALNAQEQKAIKDHLREVSFQRRLENEINRELKEQIAQRRRLVTLSNKLDRDLAKQSRGGGMLGGGVGGSLVTGLAALGVGAAVTDFTKGSIQMAAASERLENATDGLGRQFGLTADEIVNAVKRGSDNTISSYDAMLAANKALLFGIVENEQQFEDLTEIAVGLGRAMGVDAKQSLDDLTTGIGRQSKLILDNLGIIVNAEDAYQSYANQLGKTVDQLTDAEKQQAFTNATLEQGREKLKELGDQELDTAGKIERLTSNWADFQTEFGKLGDATGIIDSVNSIVEALTRGAEAWQFTIGGLENLQEAQDRVTKQNLQAGDSWTAYWEGAKSGISAVTPLTDEMLGYLDVTVRAALGNEDLAASYQEVVEEQEKAEEAAQDAAAARAAERQAAQEAEEAAQKAADAAEEEAKRLEKVAGIRERSVRQMMDIDEKFVEETKDTWADWREDQEDLFEDYSEKRTDILAKAAKDAAKIEKDLAKDLAKLSKDLTKDLAKIDKDESKKINELKEDAAKEERQQEKRRRVDALADERLFQFDLQQLGAEGNANAIKEALERRAIEEQIEREKAEVESQIKDENLEDEIRRTQEEAEERRQERQAEAEERRAELHAEAEEERQLKEEALQQALEDEKQNFFERSAELADYRDDKLAQLEQDKKDSIEKIAEQLTEIKDITKEELQALVPVFAEFGEQAGNAFSDGLSSGFETNDFLADLLGQEVGSQSSGVTYPSAGGMNFDEGGIVPGPLGQPRLAIVHGGEEVLTPQQRGGNSVTVNVSPGMERFAAIVESKMNEALQEYTDEVLGPALG